MSAYNAEKPERLLREQLPRAADKAGALPREATRLPGDIHITGDTLHLRLDPATAARRSRAIAGLCHELTATETRYPAPTSRSNTASKATTSHNDPTMSGVLEMKEGWRHHRTPEWVEVPVVCTDDDRGHGRRETRTLKILTAARGIGSPYARQVVQITRERIVIATGARTVEVVYAICSLPFEQARPAAITAWLRQHWGIENSVHWVRDVTFDEDRSTVRTGAGPQVTATVRNTVVNLHQLPWSHQHRRSLPQ